MHGIEAAVPSAPIPWKASGWLVAAVVCVMCFECVGLQPKLSFVFLWLSLEFLLCGRTLTDTKPSFLLTTGCCTSNAQPRFRWAAPQLSILMDNIPAKMCGQSVTCFLSHGL